MGNMLWQQFYPFAIFMRNGKEIARFDNFMGAYGAAFDKFNVRHVASVKHYRQPKARDEFTYIFEVLDEKIET